MWRHLQHHFSGDDLTVDVLVAAADRWAVAVSKEPSNQLETLGSSAVSLLVFENYTDNALRGA